MRGSQCRTGYAWPAIMIAVLVASLAGAEQAVPPAEDETLDVVVLAVPMRTADGRGCYIQAVIEVAGAGLAVHGGDQGVTGLVAPEPVAPEPVAPEPVAPEPVAPEPVAPKPVETGSAKTGSVEIVLHAFAVDATDPTASESTSVVADAATETVTFDRQDLETSRGVKLVTSLSLAPGHYRLRALAHDTVSGRRGVTYLPLVVAAEPVLMLPPLIPELGDTWTVARSERPGLNGQAPPPPFFVEDQVFMPAAQPYLEAGARRLPVVVMGYGLRDHEAEIISEVFDQGGNLVPGTQLVVSLAHSARDGIDRIMGVLYLPELPAGGYTLALEASDGVTTAKVATPFAVGGPHQPSRLLRIVAPEIPPPVVAAYRPQESIPAAPAVPVKEMVEGYRALLAGLDSDNREARIQALADFEIAAVADEPEARIPRLKKSQLKVVRELAKRDPEALVPLLTLHHDTCLAHRRSRRAWLGRHGADMLVEVAAVYAPPNRGRGARIVAAQALASLGGHLQAVGQNQGLELFRVALEYQPGHAAALIGLAADPEKRGGPYEVAVRHLERLLEAHPKHREGRLRLALNLIRVDAAHGEDLAAGQLRRAQTVLEEVVAGDEADWVYALAAQELARLYVKAGKVTQAIRLLTKASGRLPEEQKMRIQLAHCLDRVGRPAEAQAVLAELRPDWTGMTPPRGRYNRWPNRALDADRAALAEGAKHRRPLLVRAARGGAGGVL